MSLTKSDLEGLSRNEAKKLVRENCPGLIAEIKKEAKRQLEREGKIGTKLEKIVQSQIEKKAGTSTAGGKEIKQISEPADKGQIHDLISERAETSKK